MSTQQSTNAQRGTGEFGHMALLVLGFLLIMPTVVLLLLMEENLGKVGPQTWRSAVVLLLVLLGPSVLGLLSYWKFVPELGKAADPGQEKLTNLQKNVLGIVFGVMVGVAWMMLTPAFLKYVNLQNIPGLEPPLLGVYGWLMHTAVYFFAFLSLKVDPKTEAT